MLSLTRHLQPIISNPHKATWNQEKTAVVVWHKGTKTHLENRKCIQILKCKALCNKAYPSDYEVSKQLFFFFFSVKNNKPNQGENAVFSNCWYICISKVKQDRWHAQTPEQLQSSGISENIMYVILGAQCRFRLNMHKHEHMCVHKYRKKKLASYLKWDFLFVKMCCLHLPTSGYDSGDSYSSLHFWM